jgi:hypothetical protein
MRTAQRPLRFLAVALTKAIKMITPWEWLRIGVAAASALAVAGVSLQIYGNAVVGFPSGAAVLEVGALALVTAVLAAVITALVEARHGRKRAIPVAIAVAYLGTRALSMGIHYPGSLDSWSPYPLLGWLSQEWIPVVLIMLQIWLLRPVCFRILRSSGAARRRVIRVAKRVPLLRDRAHARRLAVLLVCGLVFIGWDWLAAAVGAASAAFLCALAMVGVMLLASDHIYLLFGIVACAGFLAVSALVQQAPPSDVLVQDSFSTPEIYFGIAPPAGAKVDTSALQLQVIMVPLAPTLFHCPSQVEVEVLIEDQDEKVQGQLSQAKYSLNVPGNSVVQLPDPSTLSTRYTGEARNGAPTTQLFGSGLDVLAQPPFDLTVGGGFIFTAPLQSWRSMGTCYVVIPTVDPITDPGPYGYSITPVKATVELWPWQHSSIDLTDTTPQPTADQMTQDAFDWTCKDLSNVTVQGNGQCPAVAVVTTNWANSYTQFVMLLVGTLIAIAAERWFHFMKLDESPPDGKRSAELLSGALSQWALPADLSSLSAVTKT